MRFGGLAAILLAVTSWLAVVAYYTIAQRGQDEVGMEIVALLAALVAFWSLFAVTAVHWTLRAHGEAWSLFAVLVGLAAAVGAMTAALYPVAFTRAVLARPLDASAPSPIPVAVAATDPLNVMSLGLTGLWFVIVSLLLWRGRTSRGLAIVGMAAAAMLLFGFFAALGAQASVVPAISIVAGVVVVPLFWLWAGILLRRA